MSKNLNELGMGKSNIKIDLSKTEIIQQTSNRKYLKIINNVDLTENYKNLTIIPKDTFEIEFRFIHR